MNFHLAVETGALTKTKARSNRSSRSIALLRSKRLKPDGSSKFKSSTFNDHSPLPIFRNTLCSEVCAGWDASAAQEGAAGKRVRK